MNASAIATTEKRVPQRERVRAIVTITGSFAARPPTAQRAPYNPPRRGAREAYWKRARKVWAARDLTPITLHECRHTFASLTAASGTGLEDLSEWMGHTSLNLTWKTYRHLYPEAAEAARLRLDAYLAPSTIELRGLTRSIEDSLHRNSAPPRPV